MQSIAYYNFYEKKELNYITIFSLEIIKCKGYKYNTNIYRSIDG